MPQPELRMSVPGRATIHIDGASRGNPGEASIGVLISEDGKTVEEIKERLGVRTNNQAEYTALLTALRRAAELGYSTLDIYTDSLLLANQVNGRWKVKDPGMRELWSEARGLISAFGEVRVSHIPREQNLEADRLANEALDGY